MWYRQQSFYLLDHQLSMACVACNIICRQSRPLWSFVILFIESPVYHAKAFASCTGLWLRMIVTDRPVHRLHFAPEKPLGLQQICIGVKAVEINPCPIQQDM